jgi:hypothetical protein
MDCAVKGIETEMEKTGDFEIGAKNGGERYMDRREGWSAVTHLQQMHQIGAAGG